MAKNIFTCSRTNPLPIGGSVASGNTDSIPLPNYSTLTSDEMKKLYQDMVLLVMKDFMELLLIVITDFNQYTNYDLEYPKYDGYIKMLLVLKHPLILHQRTI